MSVRETISQIDRDRAEAVEADETGEGFIADMFEVELTERGFAYTFDPTDALDVIGLNLVDIMRNPALLRGFRLACERIEKRGQDDI